MKTRVFHFASMSKFSGIYELFFTQTGLSKGTCDTYRPIYEEWFKVLGGDDKVLQAIRQDVWLYVGWLRSGKGVVSQLDGSDEISQKTIDKKLAALKSLYRYLADIQAVKENPFLGQELISRKRKSSNKRLTNAVPAEYVPAICSAPGLQSKEAIRDSAFLALLFYCGLRISEVCTLEMDDVRKTTLETLFVRLRKTKAGKTVNLAVPDAAVDILLRYFQQRRLEGADIKSPVFCSYRGIPKRPMTKPLHRKSLYLLFKYYLQCVRLDPKLYSPHSGRRTAITQVAKSCKSILEVQEFSRHESVQSVEPYLKPDFGLENSPQKKLRY